MLKKERNCQIFAEYAKGLTPLEIAEIHGISRARVLQILKAGDSGGKTLAQLPGTESLSSITRGLLIRRGYRCAESLLADIRTGKLRLGCMSGVGAHRVAEIKAWVDAQPAKSFENTGA